MEAYPTYPPDPKPLVVAKPMPDYKSIYNSVVTTDPRYVLAENSPGFRAVVQAESTLMHLAGRSLDVGCGPGFAMEFLSGRQFQLLAHGVDISSDAVAMARSRLKRFPDINNRLLEIDKQSFPFDADYFSLVTCFDVLEHLDESDIDATLGEIQRVMRPGGTFYGAVSCRKSGIKDQFGDNLHRTVQPTDWWIQKFRPDQAIYDGQREQFVIWKRAPFDGGPLFAIA